jgi:hypothetical protein
LWPGWRKSGEGVACSRQTRTWPPGHLSVMQ